MSGLAMATTRCFLKLRCVLLIQGSPTGPLRKRRKYEEQHDGGWENERPRHPGRVIALSPANKPPINIAVIAVTPQRTTNSTIWASRLEPISARKVNQTALILNKIETSAEAFESSRFKPP